MSLMLSRSAELESLRKQVARNPVTAILGPRQVGKTTLARAFAARYDGPVTFLDLEDPSTAAALADASLFLAPLRGLVVLDEIQRLPEVFPTLRVLADRSPLPARFLVLGSASPDLLRQSSESLAGRVAFHDLGGLALDEVGAPHLERLWLRGGFPRAYLAEDDAQSAAWRRDFVRTFLERDLPSLGIGVAAPTMHRFWTMLAHWHGQLWNGAELARSFGVSQPTVRRYLDHLEATYVVRVLPPWSENLAKRQVKSPRVYVADTGLLHTLLGLEGQRDVLLHPKVGASWEGFAASLVERRLGVRRGESWFWRTQAGAELDLLVVRGNRRLGFEIKRTDAPRLTRSMRIAMADLGLDRLDVVHAGERSFPLAEDIRALSLHRVLDDLEPL